MTVEQFNKLPEEEQRSILFGCCGSEAWVKAMLHLIPFQNLDDLLEFAEEQWYECNHSDWLEAFENLARLGDKSALAREDTPKFGKKEQAALLSSDRKVIEQLVTANEEYEENFGYMFISFAMGKSGEQLLAEIADRLDNDPRDEINIAAAELDKITKRRLKKIFS
ncbi:MAG: 2-oxo-4-hydroxy-4-carboxy-5-ureidoimidazoline decarboxylase [Chitinophagaceae bacterium]|nr:2-oxo-4-hydroxy-4-carboxy-5-ureidoimidazoline decarboxylase [Chitinophagaceae bacterium]